MKPGQASKAVPAKAAAGAKAGVVAKAGAVAKVVPAPKAGAVAKVVPAPKAVVKAVLRPDTGGPMVGRKGSKPAIMGKSGKQAGRKSPPEVRPIGMLPPEALARATNRAPVRPVAPRPSPPKVVRPSTPSEGVQRVTEKDMKEFEDRLLTERRKILKEMGHLESTVLKVNQRDSSGDLSGYSFHMADAGTDAMEREKAFLFASVEGRVLLEIDDALRRLYRGEYGVCESCATPIARARLEVMPHARLCVRCKEKEERTQRGAM